MKDQLLSIAPSGEGKKSHLGSGILELRARILEYGICPVYETDFRAHRDASLEYSDRGVVTGVYDPEKCEIGPLNGFWIRGMDETGRTVHAQAMRYDDLGKATLASHWLENSSLFRPPGLNIDIAKSNLTTAPASHEISGEVCYHGDFWMAKTARKFGLAPLLAQLAMLVALVRFSPDFLYGLVLPKNVKKGWAAQQGYLHTYPLAQSWHIREEAVSYDEYLVWVTGAELDRLWRSGKRQRDAANKPGLANQRLRPVMEDAAGQ